MLTPKLPLLSRAFKGEDRYRPHGDTGYALLPLRFLRLDTRRYIVSSIAGDYTVLTNESLHALVRHTLSPSDPAYEALKAKHLLIDSDSNVAVDLLAAKLRTKHSQLSQLTSLFMFVVTLRCEHSCPYCQVSRQSQDRSAFDMSQAHADKALDIAFSSPARHIKLEFQGGEPLLNFELIRYIVENAAERNLIHGKELAFVIATNLALITDEILEFCKQHSILISTSLDGPQSLHNANRPRPSGDSYERTIQGIQRARAVLGVDRVAALMTTTKASLSQPEAIIDEYVAQDFHSIFLRGLSPYGFAIRTRAFDAYHMQEWLEFYKRGLAHILKLNRDGVFMREEYAALLMRKMHSPFPTNYVDLQSPAGAGLSALAFNYDGAVYASDESRMLAEMKDQRFRLGHVETDTLTSLLTSDSYLDLIASTMTECMPMCADCGLQPFCGSDPVYHYATQGDVVGLKPASGFCHKNMEIMRHLVTLLEDDLDARRILMSWIG